MSENLIIDINNLHLKSSRGDDVFSDLNFSLKTGRSALITGAAGSGKSSFIELLIGRQFASQGSIEIFSELIKPRRKKLIKSIRRRVGGVGGLFSLIPSYTVSENIMFPMVLNSDKKKVRRERLTTLLTEFSLLKQASEYPANLTRVENTLVQFARATAAFQPLIIIDEPLAGVDKVTYKRIYDYMIKMSASGQSMIILSGESLPEPLPNSDSYQILNGALV